MAKVPTIPNAQIAAIKDPAIRDVLRAVADHISVRSGDIGNGDQAFLTLADITGDRGKALKIATALGPPLQQGMNTPGQPLADLAEDLRDSIRRSPWWQEMFTRLSLIDAPDTVPGSLANRLLLEARERGASITHVENVVQGVNESLVQVNDTLTAAIGDNAAAIGHETELRVSADEAIVKVHDAFVTSVGKSFAGVDKDMTLRVNNENALVDAINTMWARVGTNQALVQSGTQIAVNPVGSTATKFDQLQAVANGAAADAGAANKQVGIVRQDLSVTANAVDGLKGKWGVKIDLNGYVAGVSLNSGVSTGGKAESMFIVVADKFAIGAPGKPDAVPFAIDAKTGLVAIDGSLVATGTISGKHLSAYAVGRDQIALKAVGGAQIDDLAVDTLKIKGNSVIVGTYDETGGIEVRSGSTTLISRTINLGDNNSSGLIVNGCISLASADNSSAGFRIYINGVRCGDQRVGLQGGWTYLVPATGYGGARSGVVTVTLEAYVTEKPFTIYSATMSVIGGKR